MWNTLSKGFPGVGYIHPPSLTWHRASADPCENYVWVGSGKGVRVRPLRRHTERQTFRRGRRKGPARPLDGKGDPPGAQPARRSRPVGHCEGTTWHSVWGPKEGTLVPRTSHCTHGTTGRRDCGPGRASFGALGGRLACALVTAEGLPFSCGSETCLTWRVSTAESRFGP